MAKKNINWKTKGMNRDMSVSAFSPEFAFENVNLRLATNEGNTMLSWVNEKGTKEITIKSGSSVTAISGTVIGTAVINHQLVLFTHEEITTEATPAVTYSVDRIYKLKYNDDKTEMSSTLLYQGNLNFDVEYPLETLVDYETDSIQKVYWTDGKNQPRLINIASPKSRWINSGTSHKLDYYFDFVPTFNASRLSVSITNNQSSGGTFAPGVIQYCFTYINKFGQQSNIVYCSTLYYLAMTDRGASPTERVSASFSIELSGLDDNFDYVRLYSIQRTSVNDTPIVKLLDDLKIESIVKYVDNGTTGSMMDPSELLYVGGREISALTMESKDGTLFMGNLEQKNVNVKSIQTKITELANKTGADKLDITFQRNKTIDSGGSKGIYNYSSTLSGNQSEITTFKGGEWYRFGFQLQKKNGEWTDPIHIVDKQNELYPKDNDFGMPSLVRAYANIDISAIANEYDGDFYNTFKKIRPVIVYPNINDRSVICQGVLNPTVFNVEDKTTHSPDAQPSWFFRPYYEGNLGVGSSTSGSASTATEGVGVNVTGPSEQQTLNWTVPNGNVRSYFVIVGDVKKEDEKGLIESKRLRYKKNSSTAISYADFVGVIKIKEVNNYYTKYAFFGNIAFPTNKRLDGSTQSLYYTDIVNVEYSSAIFGLSTSVIPNVDGYFYYCSSGTTHYKDFKFFTDNKDWNDYHGVTTFGPVKLYSVDFTPINKSSTDVVVVQSQRGSALRFKHYDSIYSDAEAGYDNADYVKQVEIQGSVNKYPRAVPSSDSEEADKERKAAKNINSNTQFFIDQSIVTLNSPDIEFDTDVQNYNTSGLKLRIVGAIPLTSTVSSHTIKVSSEMLPINYSSKEDTNSESHKFGIGEKDMNVISSTAGTAYKRLVAESLWNDVKVSATIEDDKTVITTSEDTKGFTVYPWHRTGSLNNDVRGKAEASSFLQYKRLANLWCSRYNDYFDISGDNKKSVELNTSGIQIPLTENAEVMNYRLGSSINYYANIDKVLVNGDGYNVKVGPYEIGKKVSSAVSMKYKSTTHAAISLGSNILPKTEGGVGAYSSSGNTFWGTSSSFNQLSINYTPSGGFLWLGELYRTNVSNRFGNVKYNNWLPAGIAKSIDDGSKILLCWDEGDTYYQRYDCLKTYPFTEDDTNQIIEILSFMCETHVNIDGRYDRNRGMMNNVNVRPTNFNLLNPAYSQRNNFFSYKKVDIDSNEALNYPNQIYYSKTKQSGADVDMWTNVTLASTLEMDGNKGSVNSIQRFNDQLIAFQDSGIAQILYNENVQIATTNGVPVELANSGKVQGKRYISNTVGCSNKWSIVQSPMGIYFMDSNEKSIYLFNGQLSNVSTSKGFNAWCKENIPSSDVKWDPVEYNNFRAFYDKMNQDVLFVNSDTALAYSEKVENFTSFYDYGEAPYFENLDDTGVWVKNGKLWKHRDGEYCQFFGENKPYSMTLVGNQEPLMDKIFTNMEFRACVEDEGRYDTDTDKFVASTPFDSLESWNEYQHGITELTLRAAGSSSVHSSLERKFRVWRCDIPRDNYPLSVKKSDGSENTVATAVLLANEKAKGIKRFKVRPLDRMRNPWVYLKLEKKAERNSLEEGETTLPVLPKVEVHDVVGSYFG